MQLAASVFRCTFRNVKHPRRAPPSDDAAHRQSGWSSASFLPPTSYRRIRPATAPVARLFDSGGRLYLPCRLLTATRRVAKSIPRGAGCARGWLTDCWFIIMPCNVIANAARMIVLFRGKGQRALSLYLLLGCRRFPPGYPPYPAAARGKALRVRRGGSRRVRIGMQEVMSDSRRWYAPGRAPLPL